MLEHGEIVERGTHDELLAKDGRYRQLYDKQYRFERDRFINPGEDFTPEPEKVVGRGARQQRAVIDVRVDCELVLDRASPRSQTTVV